MSVQQPFTVKIKNSNFSLSKRHISHTSPPSEVTSLSEFTSTTFPSPQPLIIMVLRARLPFSGQLGAPEFDGTDITRFVKEWDDIYEDYKIKTIKKTRRVPKYITKVIKEYVRAQEEYEKRD
jgi:hypothetical protein